MVPSGIVFPIQTHSNIIKEVISGHEDLSDTDGVWTLKATKLTLGIKTADCAPIAFLSGDKYGIVHAGWRGLVGGIIESMAEIMGSRATIFVGPLLPQFEIQRDSCYKLIQAKFGNTFIHTSDKGIIFDFKSAIHSIIPHAKFDPRSTSADPTLASWRENHTSNRNTMTVSA